MSRDTKSGRQVYEGAMRATTDALMAADAEIARLRSRLAMAEGVVEAAPDAVAALDAHLCLGECCTEGRAARDALRARLAEWEGK